VKPVAIIGIGCRFPGAPDTKAFWQLLRNGVDAIGEVPEGRWNLDEFLSDDPDTPGTMRSRWGGFIEHVDEFDPHFFGISPREAVYMDPQQRLFLEVAWESLEDAGQQMEALRGQSVGVYLGMASFDYGALQLSDPFSITDGYVNTGSALSIAANRISYLFDFRGPSMVIDTACSSSLVAVHLACRSLAEGESSIAVAGGVNLILSPVATIGFDKLNVMAADGRCKAFDARADGYVRSEGAGAVVLKPLDEAIADGDRVYAVIRGGAVNQDGRTNGLTAPNGPSQEALVREALVDAEVEPAAISYVEAHGTGTALGDPIELNSLGEVLATGRPDDRPCAVGSVKSNCGHLEAAAGIAGLIKVALSLEHLEIPPSLHFQQPNPHIPFDRLPFEVQTSLGSWPKWPGRALAGVSSFGFGGTNAHLVLEEPPAGTAAAEDASPSSHEACLFPLSARSAPALRVLAESYHELLTNSGADTSPPGIEDVCYSAALRRSHLEHRLALVASSTARRAAAGTPRGSARRRLQLRIEDPGSTAKAGLRIPGPGLPVAGNGTLPDGA
jgi:acyl transferase domain-containing protein